ncbi:MAG TPA: deoxyribose-phosphate aldolase [Nitrososphaerales archaeon]|nr:deoxyribose-phosphate aldolase [Nitrososphaerales archaeon]
MAAELVEGRGQSLSRSEFARKIDHTLLRATATTTDIDQLCDEALRFDFWSVCVAPCNVRRAKERVEESAVKVCAVVGFPLGADTASIKLAEAVKAVEDGADEIDMVLNIGAFKSGDDDLVFNEINSLAQFCHTRSRLLKVIIECCYLADDEKVKAARLAELAGADFVKTSTGMGTGGATVEDVRLLRKTLLPKTRIKAAGGIGTLEKALGMIAAGADRIGTSSGAKIMGEWPAAADSRFVAKPKPG